VKIGFKFQSLGKISNISAADSPVLLGQFQHCIQVDRMSRCGDMAIRNYPRWRPTANLDLKIAPFDPPTLKTLPYNQT